MPNNVKKTKSELIPGTVIECKSGRFLAFYEHRTDIIANGENERDARKNLRELYQMTLELEEQEGVAHEDDDQLSLPASFVKRTFKERV
jgi:predicted RNase H-like HicB family nuclease